MFVPNRPTQPSLILMRKAEAYLVGAPEGRVCSGLSRKNKTVLERPARDKHSSLFCLIVNYKEIKFYKIGPSCLTFSKKIANILNI
jgi:hypothetical protein